MPTDTQPQAPAAATSERAPLPPPQFREAKPERETALNGAQAAKAAAVSEDNAKGLTAQEATSALDWFLSDSPNEASGLQKVVEVNVGSAENPHWIAWRIRAVDMDELRHIQKISERAAGRKGEDDMVGTLKVIVAGTVDPDLSAATLQKGGIADPAMALRQRFRHKPGLLGQIAGEIMAISGFDDEDVREAQAAGN